MRNIKLFSLFIVVALLLGLSSCGKDKKEVSNEFFTIPRVEFKTGETIHLIFQAPSGLKDNAWIGLIPSEVKHGSESENDSYDVAYQYLNGKTKGMMMFTAPDKPGKYDFRLNSTDENGKELGFISFEVK